jgi:hypothetical protein
VVIKKTISSTFLLLFIPLLSAIVAAAEQSGTAKIKAGTFEVKVSRGYLSLVEANNAPLAKVFHEIGKQGNITVESGVGPEEKTTIQ